MNNFSSLMPAPGLARVSPSVTLALEPTLETDGGRESLSQRAYLQIRKALISSALRPGHRLILRPLAAELALSPTPVREALLRLVSEQALALDERGSAIVPVMTQASFRELIEMRGDLEARAAERAVEHVTEQQIDEIERTNARCIAHYLASEYVPFLESNAVYHHLVCKAGQAPMILRMLEGLWMRLGPLYALCFDEPFPPLGDAEHPHCQLIAALRRRDVAGARNAVLLDVIQSSHMLEPKLIQV